MKLEVFIKDLPAGILEKRNDEMYFFSYFEKYLESNDKLPLSLTMPTNNKEYFSDHLFPCFFNILPEGFNKNLVCRMNKIDERDYFTLLSTVARTDTIGHITVKPLTDDSR